MSVFTKNGMGDGKSTGMKSEKIGSRGDTLVTAHAADNLHGVAVKNTLGGKFGGSPTNLSHSLSGGVSAVQDRVGKSSR